MLREPSAALHSAGSPPQDDHSGMHPACIHKHIHTHSATVHRACQHTLLLYTFLLCMYQNEEKQPAQLQPLSCARAALAKQPTKQRTHCASTLCALLCVHPQVLMMPLPTCPAMVSYTTFNTQRASSMGMGSPTLSLCVRRAGAGCVRSRHAGSQDSQAVKTHQQVNPSMQAQSTHNRTEPH